MKIIRATIAGALVWTLIFSLFAVLSLWSVTQASEWLQAAIVGIAIIPFASLGTYFYYKNGHQGNGLIIALIMVGTAMLLDALITVPYFEIPYNDRGYYEFFTNPILWILVGLNLAVIYVFWYRRFRPSNG